MAFPVYRADVDELLNFDFPALTVFLAKYSVRCMKKGLSPLLWVLVAVFFIRAMMPVGFMPDFSGKHFLTICSGTGISTVAVDDNNQPLPEQPQQKTTAESCPFSFLSTATLSDPNADLSLLSAPIAVSEGMLAFFLTGILPLSLQNNHLSRAPPTLS